MQKQIDLHSKVWWDYIDEDLKLLFEESLELVRRVRYWEQKFHDYSFVVFPAAKAYEGFLKKLFLDMGFITTNDYQGRRFRIGRALNPELDNRYRKSESVYDRLRLYCGGDDLPDQLWSTWKESRNKLFHWFYGEENIVSYPEAKERIEMIVNSIDAAFVSCEIPKPSKMKK